jgi:hypothetical protein
MPETYGPVLLARKATRLRKETGDNRYYAPKEVDKPDIGRRLYNILAMPFKILFLEPMLIAIVVYQSVSSLLLASFRPACPLTDFSFSTAASISCLKRTQLCSREIII